MHHCYNNIISQSHMYSTLLIFLLLHTAWHYHPVPFHCNLGVPERPCRWAQGTTYCFLFFNVSDYINFSHNLEGQFGHRSILGCWYFFPTSLLLPEAHNLLTSKGSDEDLADNLVEDSLCIMSHFSPAGFILICWCRPL